MAEPSVAGRRPPTFADVEAAAARIRPHVHRTPVMTCASIDERVGARLFFKCENLQKVGAFKFRGATNTVRSLDEATATHGVATHSSGNHAAALARAARERGLPAFVVMPRTAPPVKVAAVKGYGAEVVFCEPTQAAREEALARVVAETGAHFVHPYDDPRVIAGQGTVALELHADVPDLDAVLVPVGGGGLTSGTVIATRGVRPRCRVVACEPAGADDAWRSMQSGRVEPSVAPRTVCDGLLTSLSPLTFSVLRERGVEVVRVSEQAVLTALRLLLERAKTVVEPSAAVPLAALLDGAVTLPGARVGIVLSGGNLDLDALSDILRS